MGKEDIYYSDLNEIEAYDTEARYTNNNEKALPLTQAGVADANGVWHDAYNDIQKGEAWITRFQNSGTELAKQELLRNGIELNATSFYDKESQKYNRKTWKEVFGLTDKQIDDIYERARGYIEGVKDLYEKHPFFKEWEERPVLRADGKGNITEDGIPVQNVWRSNGDYDLNQDNGTFCPKKEGMNAMITYVAKKFKNISVGPVQMEQLADICKKWGLIVPCKMCFVEMRRIRGYDSAASISYDWISVLKGIGLDDEVELNFKVGAVRNLSKEKEQAIYKILDEMTSEDESVRKKAYEKYIDDDRKRKEVVKYDKQGNIKYKKGKPDVKTLDNGTTADKMYKIAKLFKQDLRLAGIPNPINFMYTDSMDTLYKTFAGHTGIREFLSGVDGSQTPKPLEGIFPYDPLSYKNIKNYNEEKILKNRGLTEKGEIDLINKDENIFDIGGVRSQSFSDYIPLFFSDYV